MRNNWSIVAQSINSPKELRDWSNAQIYLMRLTATLSAVIVWTDSIGPSADVSNSENILII